MENKDNKKVKVQVKGLVKSFGELEVLKEWIWKSQTERSYV